MSEHAIIGRLGLDALPFWDMIVDPTRENIVNGLVASAAAGAVVLGGLVVAIVRTHQAFGLGGGFLSDEHWGQLFTTHGSIMIFFMAMPFLTGLINHVVPLPAGAARDMSVAVRKHPGINLGDPHGRAHDKAETMVFGFWVFMMSDVIVFGLLIATYVTMLGPTAGGPGPKELFELRSAFIETLLLLASSFTFGMASLAMKYRRARSTPRRSERGDSRDETDRGDARRPHDADAVEQERAHELRSYVLGLVSALVLSAAAFALVAFPAFERTVVLWTIGSLAIVQIVAHLRWFLHIDLSQQKREDLQLILFSTLLLIMMGGGTLWIMFNLYGRMAPGMMPVG